LISFKKSKLAHLVVLHTYNVSSGETH